MDIGLVMGKTMGRLCLAFACSVVDGGWTECSISKQVTKHAMSYHNNSLSRSMTQNCMWLEARAMDKLLGHLRRPSKLLAGIIFYSTWMREKVENKLV